MQDKESYMENAEVKEKNKPGIKTVIPWAVLVLSLCTAIFYIFCRERADFNIDYTDTLLWAAASVEGRGLVNHDFWYAYIIPFSGYLIMIPLVMIFGVTYLAHALGMAIFTLLFAAAIFFGCRAVGLTYEKSAALTGILILILCGSSITRMIFFGHVIHYSMAMIFTSVALILLKRTQCLYAVKFTAGQWICYGLLLIWNYLACLNGSSALALYFCPIVGALVLERLLDERDITFAEIRIPVIRLVIMCGAAGMGFLTKRYMIQPYFDSSYEEGFSSLLSHEEWFFKEQGFLVRFSTLLTDWVYNGTPMLSMDGFFILLRLMLAVIILTVPVIALFFYKRCNNKLMRILLLDYWVLFGLIMLTYSVSKIQEASWRLASLLGMSIIVSLVYILWALKEKFFCRFAYLLLAVFILTACTDLVSVATLSADDSVNGYVRLAAVLDEHGLTYGYTDLWGGANAITVLTDSRIKVRAVKYEGENSYSIDRYQGQASWYEDQPGVERYFAVIPNDYLEIYKDSLVAGSIEQIPFEETTILVFDKNIFKDGQQVYDVRMAE